MTGPDTSIGGAADKAWFAEQHARVAESRKRNTSPVDPVEVVARAINPRAFQNLAEFSMIDAYSAANRAVAALRAEGLLA